MPQIWKTLIIWVPAFVLRLHWIFALNELKEAGYQIIGLDGNSETSIENFKFSKHLVMAIGGEDKGLPPYIKKFCDSVLKIPMSPEAHSYNTSVALSLGLYAANFLPSSHG